MADKFTFKRQEYKYLVTREQKEEILRRIADRMEIDEYGKTVIRNIYFDTPDYYLIRESLTKPVYKEKLRVRSYGPAADDSKVFVELKKKYKSVVYKRRVSMNTKEAETWLYDNRKHSTDSQITREIEYFVGHYGGLKPRLFLSYEREAYFMKDGSDFRLTFDENIIARETDLDLRSEVYGDRVLEEGKFIMELKISDAMPLWMSKILSEMKIFRTSFSKYGTYYTEYIHPRMWEMHKNEKTCGAACYEGKFTKLPAGKMRGEIYV